MTFIINILHKEYSLLLADNRSCEIYMDDIEYDSVENITDKVNKINLFANNKLAIAHAGLEDSHQYMCDIKRLSEDIDSILSKSINVLDGFILRPYGICDWNKYINSFLATYYCNENGSFQCKKFVFGSKESKHQYRGNENAIIIMAGSGSRSYKQIANLENEINKFINSLNKNPELQQVYNFFRYVYSNVSNQDHYVSATFDLYYASKDQQEWLPFDDSI